MVGSFRHRRRWWGWFHPTHVSKHAKIKLWLDASGETAADGTPMPTITDHSGYGNHAQQAVVASQAVLKTNQIGGQPVYRFDGVDDAYSCGPNLNLGQGGIAVFSILKPDTSFGGTSGGYILHRRPTDGDTGPYPHTGAAGEYYLGFADSGTGTRWTFAICNRFTNGNPVFPYPPLVPYFPRGAYSTAPAHDGTMWASDSVHIWTHIVTPAHLYIAIDGFDYTAWTGRDGSGNFTLTTEDTHLGAYRMPASYANFYKGDVAEMVVYFFTTSKAVGYEDSSDSYSTIYHSLCTKVNAWLAWKWGLQLQLDSSGYDVYVDAYYHANFRRNYLGTYPFRYYPP